ncbi:MAG: hypothetical protein WBV96_08445, partial [Polyangia bacterium]
GLARPSEASGEVVAGGGAEGRSEPYVNCGSARALGYGSLLRGACPRRSVAQKSANAPRAVIELPMTGIIAMSGILSYMSYLASFPGGGARSPRTGRPG